MDVRWYCYRFDHARFLRLRPALRAATTPAALEAHASGPMADAIIEAFVADEIGIAEARAGLVQSLCCVGEPLPFDFGLPRIIAGFERTPGMEEAAALLSAMLSAGHNLEPWLLPSAGLTGFLTPQETSAVRVSYLAWQTATHAGRRKQGRRPKIGAFRSVLALARNLMAGGPQSDETHRLLGQLLHEAARHDCGLAAISTVLP